MRRVTPRASSGGARPDAASHGAARPPAAVAGAVVVRETLPPWAAACFLASGAAGLLYEVTWSKQLSYLLGTSLDAVTAVVTAFLAGLALGAVTLGVRWSRTSRPARAYGAIELGIAGFGALSMPLLRGAVPWIAGLGAVLGAGTAAFACARFALLFVLLLPPAVLMGATLPVLVAEFERRRVGVHLARLYALNTAGAVAGSLAAGFVLVPGVGLAATTWCAAGLNVAAAAIAWRASVAGPAHGRAAPSPAAAPALVVPVASESGAGAAAAPEPDAPPVLARRARIAFAALFAASGFAALALQIAWVRMFGLVFGSSVYSFAGVLAVYLAGLAAGSAAIARRVAAPGPLARWAALEFGVGAAALLALQLVPALPDLFLRAAQGTRGNWGALYGIELAITALVVLAPCVLLGAAFPLAARLLLKREGPGAAGLAYAVNTAGTVAGTVAAGFVLVPVLGVQGTLVVAGLLSVVAGAGAVLLLAPPGRARAARWALPAAALALLLAWVAPRWDPALMSAGMFRPQQAAVIRAGRTVTGGWRSVREASRTRHVVFYREGRNGSVSVETDSVGRDFALRVGGKVDASTRDMVTQVVVGLVPAAMARAGGRAAVIGLGSGATVMAALAGGAGHIDVAEIEPAVVEASRWFDLPGENPRSDPRVNLVLQDGRTYLALGGTPYDLIVSEPSNPWLAGVNNLFTVDFYRRVRSRLAPGGVFCQWIQIYEVSPATLGCLLASFLEVFPTGDALLVQNADLVLVAAPPDRAIALDRLHSEAAARALRRAQLIGPEALSAFYRCPLPELRPLARGAPLNRDDRPIVEYRAPMDLVNSTRGGADAVDPSRVPSAGWVAAAAMYARWSPESWWTNRVQQLAQLGDDDGAMAAARQAGAAGEVALGEVLEGAVTAHERRRAVARQQQVARSAALAADFAGAEQALVQAVAIDSADGRTWVLLAETERSMGAADRARVAAGRAIACGDPAERYDATLQLGMLDAGAGRLADAVARFRDASRLLPGRATAYLFEAQARAEAGDDAAARDACRRGLAAAPGDPELTGFARQLAEPAVAGPTSGRSARKP